MVPPGDTSPDAREVQIALLRSAGPAGRLAMAADLSDAVRALAAAGIRSRHPEYDDAKVGEVLAQRARERAAVRRLLPESPK